MLWKAIHEHWFLFAWVVVLSGVGLAIGAMLIFREMDFISRFVAAIFSVVCIGSGIGVFFANISSIGYYYDKALLKHFGMDASGTVTNTCIERVSGEEEEENLNIVEYEYEYGGFMRKEADSLDDATLFAKIVPGQEIPLRVLIDRPDVSRAKWRKLKRKMQA